ncbi:MAG: tetratricopeptide repeat protein, partial [Candidatus Brocadiales bacterium]
IWCKETVCSAPIIMFLYYRCFIAKDWRSSGRGLKLVLPYIALSVVSYYLSVPHDYGKRVASYWNWWEYLLTQSNVLIEYVRLLLLPLPGRLNVDADFPLSETLWEFPTLLSGASIAAIVVTAVLLLDRSRLVAFSILWFFVTLAPTSSIMPLHEIMVSYRLYLPGVGFYLLLVVGIHKVFCYFFTKMMFEPKQLWLAELAVFMCIVMFYGACAYEHNKVFRTEVLLWEDTVKKSPNKIRPHYGLGRAYHKAGQVDRAREQYQICGRLYHAASNMRDRNEIKCAGMACNNLGLTYINAGQYDAAIPILKEAINIRDSNAEVHCNLAYCYVNTGKTEAAETEYKLALGFSAKHSQIYTGLGLVYEIKGMPEEAIRAYAKAVELDTANTNAHFRLGHLWLNHSKNPTRATYHLREALAQSTDKEDRKRILAKIESMAEISP